MTVSGKWLLPAALLVGGAIGWFARGARSEKKLVLGLNENALAVSISGSDYRYADFPADLQQSVHDAYMQANNVLRLAGEDFAARVAMNGGNARNFSWEEKLADKINDQKLRETYDKVPGFTNLGSFSAARPQLIDFVVRQEREKLIGEQKAKLVQEKALQMNWNLPLGPRLPLSFSDYPVVEVGPSDAPVVGELQVVFGYNQLYADGAFLRLDRLAGEIKKRIRLRLVSEYNGLSKEKLAIELVRCLAGVSAQPRDAWIVHYRLLEEIPKLPEVADKLDLQSYFGGVPELLKRVSSCQPKPFDEQAYRNNTLEWKSLRGSNQAMLFFEGRRLSEYDPRGIESLVREQLRE
jgi:hypothetical protein